MRASEKGRDLEVGVNEFQDFDPDGMLLNPERLARLRALELLDREAEPALDRLTRLVSSLLRAPVSLVSLVDHRRQFWISAVGLAGEVAESRGSPLTHSFCKHVVARRAPLRVCDTATDSTLRESRHVCELGIAAYLGVPLTTTDGHVLGALCAIDGKPREWTEDELRILDDLSRSVISEIELREANRLLRRQKRELERAKHEAETANAAKSRVLAHVSHDIRGSLSALSGYAAMLLEPLEEEERRSAARTIHSNCQHLLALLNDLLDFGKMEKGEVEIGSEDTNLARIAREVIELMEARAREKRLRLELSVSSDFPIRIATDPLRVRQVLTNLIGNAVKFTSRGGVSVSLVAERDEDGSEFVAMRVSDTGPGISKGDQERLFSPYTQVGEARDRSSFGTGLGLAVSRELARRMGGDVTVESRLGAGSTFTFRLPRREWIAGGEGAGAGDGSKAGVNGSARGARGGSLAGTRVLVVDDSPELCRLLTLILKREGAEVSCVHDGGAALAVMESASGVDVVVMDLEIPVLNGKETIRRFREGGRRTPIVVLSGHAVADEEGRCEELGCDAYLTKPTSAAALSETVRRLASRGSGDGRGGDGAVRG